MFSLSFLLSAATVPVGIGFMPLIVLLAIIL